MTHKNSAQVKRSAGIVDVTLHWPREGNRDWWELSPEDREKARVLVDALTDHLNRVVTKP